MTEGKLAEISIFYGAAQKYKELCSMIQFINNRGLNKCILEIGTGRGGTFWLWCQLSEINGTVISIDMPDGEFGGGYSLSEIERFKTYKKSKQRLKLIRNDSHLSATENELKEFIGNKGVDILFIDGDHTFEGVKDDFYRYKKYVNPNGLIIFHDIVEHDKVPECQVKNFWDLIKENFESYEFVDKEFDDRGWGNWGGVGIIINK